MESILKELEREAKAARSRKARRDELVVKATRKGHTRREVMEAAGFRSPNAVQTILRRAGLVALVALVVTSATRASAATIVPTDGAPDHPYQQWVDEAMVPTPPVTIQLEESAEACNGVGCASPAVEGYEINWLRIDPTFSTVQKTFYHELGHHFAWAVLSDANREWLAREVFRDEREWSDSAFGFAVEEKFAELYRRCAVRSRATWHNEFRYDPGRWVRVQQIDRGCRYLRTLAPTESVG